MTRPPAGGPRASAVTETGTVGLTTIHHRPAAPRGRDRSRSAAVSHAVPSVLAAVAFGGHGPGGAGILPARPTAAGLLEGAGTIGGLLAVYDTYGTTSTGDDVRYVYLYDGNGNVGQLVDPVPGTYATSLFKARYEYDPYGTVVQKSGAYALGNRNPFQFSTKQFDAETGMGYWGERYYRPDIGRCANRDRIGEAGGKNLYQYAANRPPGAIDARGHVPFSGAHAAGDALDWLLGLALPCVPYYRHAPTVNFANNCTLTGCTAATATGSLNGYSRSCDGSGSAA